MEIADFIQSTFFLVLGAALAHFLEKARRERKRIAVTPLFHQGLLATMISSDQPSDAILDIRDVLQNIAPGIDLPHFTAVYLITNVGNTVINNCTISVRAKNPTEIGYAVFYVGEQIVCERMTRNELTRDHFTTTWQYINASETLQLYIAAAGSHNIKDLKLEIDAEGLKTSYGRTQHICGKSTVKPNALGVSKTPHS